MITALIYLSLALIAVSLAVMLFFGLRNLARSGENKLVLLAAIVPVIVFGVCYALYGGWESGMVMTAVAMIALTALVMVGSALRGFVR